jgi:ribonuclease T2
MTLHGLWPDYGDGSYPTLCSKEAFDYNKVVAAVGLDDLEERWPNVQQAESSASYDNFWVHEWTKHGTCTGLSQIDYFETGLKILAAVGTPDAITGTALMHATLCCCVDSFRLYVCLSVDLYTWHSRV